MKSESFANMTSTLQSVSCRSHTVKYDPFIKANLPHTVNFRD